MGDFQRRVNLAANYMMRGISNSRTLDSCFEMWDGDAVVTVLVRRAMKNRRLWDAIASQWSGAIFPQSWIDTATEYAHIPTRSMPKLAAQMQEQAEARYRVTP